MPKASAVFSSTMWLTTGAGGGSESLPRAQLPHHDGGGHRGGERHADRDRVSIVRVQASNPVLLDVAFGGDDEPIAFGDRPAVRAALPKPMRAP